MFKSRLRRASDSSFIAYAIFAAFGAYFCTYAFRKPFAVAAFGDQPSLGEDLTFKSALVIAQVAGYALSKFLGIKIISELKSRSRAALFVCLILVAEAALLLFAVVPAPWNVAMLLLNGLPLGIIWGIVFSYLEGRRTSEMLGAGLSVSFIVASGAVKSVGSWLMLEFGVSEFWMPAATGAVFLLPLLGFIFLLEQIPPPSAEDVAQRSERAPMSKSERRALFRRFAPGLVLLIGFYVMLTAYRDVRDNFAAEIWTELGFGDAPAIFTISEIPIAVFVLAMLGATTWLKNHRQALRIYFWLVLGGAILVGGSAFLFENGTLGGATWMVLAGLGLYVAYVPFNCILFDRMMAAFRLRGNAGFLIYVADAFGYLGSVAVLLWKDFGQSGMSWLEFFKTASYALAALGGLLVAGAMIYFSSKLTSQKIRGIGGKYHPRNEILHFSSPSAKK